MPQCLRHGTDLSEIHPFQKIILSDEDMLIGLVELVGFVNQLE